MADSTNPKPSHEDRVNALIAEYEQRIDDGEQVDQDEFIAPYPEVAESFRQYLHDASFVERVKTGKVSMTNDTAESQMAEETLPPSRFVDRENDVPERRVFGRYRIIRPLGQGAMGVVYLAEDPELGRQVALKIPKFRDENDPESRQRFHREARAAATLNHPNICQVHDIGEQDGTPFITMAYVQGQSLSKFVSPKRQWPERDVAKLVRKIALALTEAHAKGVVHRDLKPGNIMLDQRHEPIVMDFGLAGGINKPGEEKLTQMGMLLGTPAYMSPEQAEADFAQVGPQSDIYSLGVILFELLTGHLPFQGPVASVLGQIVMGKAPLPSTLRPALDKRLEAICMKMMAKAPQDRFASAREVATTLATFVQQTPSEPKPPSEPDETISQQGLAASQHGKQTDEAVEKAIELVASQYYGQAVQLLQGIPEADRTPEVTRLLNKAVKLQVEGEQLNAQMLKAIRNRQYDGLQDLLRRLLDIDPSNLTAQDLYDKLNTYSPGRPYRLDKQGHLLSARRTSLWTLAARALRRSLGDNSSNQRGRRTAGTEPDGGSKVPMLPVAIGVGGVFLLLLTIVIFLRDGQQTVRVQIDDQVLSDQSITLHIDDRHMEIAGLGETIRIKPGDHGYELRRGDEVIRSGQFTVLKGDNPVLEISLGEATKDTPVESHANTRAPKQPGVSDRAPKARAAPRRPPPPRHSSAPPAPRADPPPAGHPPAGHPPAGHRPAGHRPAPAIQPAQAVAPFNESQAKRHQKEWADYLGVPVEMTNSIGMKLTLIPPGEFVMGSAQAERTDDAPQHRVQLTRPFFLGMHEATVCQFRTFVETTGHKTDVERLGGNLFLTGRLGNKEQSWRDPGFSQSDDHPVVLVSWSDAEAFCQWLSRKEGRVYRLPTEAEWEFSCRAGTTTRWTSGDDRRELRRAANLADQALKRAYPDYQTGTADWDDGYAVTAPVGTSVANALGVHDMHGNAWEWCRDWYDSKYYGASPFENPLGPSTGSTKAVRGGGWNCMPKMCSSSLRIGQREVTFSSDTCGFRVVCETEGKLEDRVSRRVVGVGSAEDVRPAAPLAKLPDGPSGSPIRWLGYVVYGSPEVLNQISSYTNVFFLKPGLNNAEEVIAAAKSTDRKVILAFNCVKKQRDGLEDRLRPLLRKHRDVIAAVCWEEPYWDDYSPNEVAAFGQWLKGEFPGCRYWCSFTERPGGKPQTLPVPHEVDVLVVNKYSDATADKVRGKADQNLPDWMNKARGRPVVLRWLDWERSPPGLVPRCQPGTMRACLEAARKHGLAGLILDHYGSYPMTEGPVGIDTNRRMVAEIQDMARELGFTRTGPVDGVRDKAAQHDPATEPGYVNLFNGRDLTGWTPFRSRGRQQQPGGGDWIVRNGQLICDGDETAWLRSDRQFADFVLELEFKIPADANSGILVRCPERGFPAMAIQLAGRSLSARMVATRQTGAIVGVTAPRANVQRGPDEWNTMQIRCEGDDIAIRMNGTAIVEANMQREEELRNRPRSGFIGFVNSSNTAGDTARGPAKSMALRNIRIKELKPVARAVQHDPAEAERLVERGNEHARRSQWKPAAADYAKAVELDPSRHLNWLYLAALRLRAGDMAGYRQVANDMLARFSQTDDPWAAERSAKVCLLAPNAVSDVSVPLELAERAITMLNEQPTLKRNDKLLLKWARITKGTAEYRNGQFADAVKSLDRNWKPDHQDTGLWKEFASLEKTMASSFLAMAHHQLDQTTQSRRSLAEAKLAIQAKSSMTSGGDLGVLWADWMMCEIVANEAEAVLNDAR